MLIFLYGEDSFRSSQKLNQIRDKAKKADSSGLNSVVLEAEGLEFDKFRKEVRATPFLAKKRLIILKNTIKSGSKNLKDKLTEFLKKEEIPESSVAIFWEENLPDQRQGLFKTLAKKAKSENFEALEGFKLNSWIQKEVAARGAQIDRDAINLLASFVGSNLWQMGSEIEKLILYRKNNQPSEIGIADVQNLVRAELDDNIFNFIDALASKNQKQALKLLHEQIELGKNEIYLLSMITYQFRNLILVLDLMSAGVNDQYQISKETKIHPYVVKKMMWNINKFNLSRLREIYAKLLEVDMNLKRTAINPLLSLDMLVCELCK